jgi:hypothetical protein
MRVQLKAICMPQFSPFSHFNLQRNLMLYILDLQLALQQVHSLVSCRNGSSRGYISIPEVNSCATKGSLGRLQFPPSGHRMGWDAEAVRNMHDAQQTRCGPGRRRGSTSYGDRGSPSARPHALRSPKLCLLAFNFPTHATRCAQPNTPATDPDGDGAHAVDRLRG